MQIELTVIDMQNGFAKELKSKTKPNNCKHAFFDKSALFTPIKALASGAAFARAATCACASACSSAEASACTSAMASDSAFASARASASAFAGSNHHHHQRIDLDSTLPAADVGALRRRWLRL